MMPQTADRIDRLEKAIRSCRQCGLYKKRLHAVPGEGPPDARVMFVGEAPGAAEDRTGRPFIGPAGKFLDQLFAGNSIRRSSLYLTSCLKCRPPGNRNPRASELDTCVSSWLLPQIQLIKPEIIVLCGRIAAGQLLGIPVKITEIHGSTYQRNGQVYFITFHPAAGMRFPRTAAAMRKDFRLLAALMSEPGR